MLEYKWKPTDRKVIVTGDVALTIILPKIPSNLDKMRDVTPKNEPRQTLALDNIANRTDKT